MSKGPTDVGRPGGLDARHLPYVISLNLTLGGLSKCLHRLSPWESLPFCCIFPYNSPSLFPFPLSFSSPKTSWFFTYISSGIEWGTEWILIQEGDMHTKFKINPQCTTTAEPTLSSNIPAASQPAKVNKWVPGSFLAIPAVGSTDTDLCQWSFLVIPN